MDSYLGHGTTAGELLNFFKTDTPVQVVDWSKMAQLAGYGTDGAAKMKYITDVFLAFLMAFAVMYLFYTLLSQMPYIGASMILQVGGAARGLVLGQNKTGEKK